MTIAVNTLTPYKSGWAINATSANASGCEQLLAAPGTGKSLYLEGLIISTDSAISITIGAGATGAAVTAAVLGPIAFAVNQTILWRFARPIKITTNTALVVDASGAGNITVYAEGYTQ